MKSKTITHIILEGVDGVGKDTILNNLWPKYNFKYRVYVRGELSDFVYAKRYNREFISTQRGLPFLYVLLTCNKEEIAKRIKNRETDENVLKSELNKIDEQDLFIECAKQMSNDYHIITINCDNLSIEECSNKIYDETLAYINSLKDDDEINSFNDMYVKGCSKVGLNWHVKNNQPYIGNDMIMADAQLHNGRFETFSNRTCPHNLLFSLGYTNTNYINYNEFNQKPYDFSYPINSKILVRTEIYDYIKEISSKYTILSTDSKYLPNLNNLIRMQKVFGDDYISAISQSKATIYCSRDLAYLKMMTVRCYEAVLANQIIFVDKLTDPDCEILSSIYDDDNIIDLLYVDETTICENYAKVISNEKLVNTILKAQHNWYNTLVKEINYEN